MVHRFFFRSWLSPGFFQVNEASHTQLSSKKCKTPMIPSSPLHLPTAPKSSTSPFQPYHHSPIIPSANLAAQRWHGPRSGFDAFPKWSRFAPTKLAQFQASSLWTLAPRSLAAPRPHPSLEMDRKRCDQDGYFPQLEGLNTQVLMAIVS